MRSPPWSWSHAARSDGRTGGHGTPDPATGHGARQAGPATRRPGGPAAAAGSGHSRPSCHARSARRSLQDDPPALDDGPHEVRRRPVRELADGRYPPDHEVGCLAGFERTHSSPSPRGGAALIVTAASASAGGSRSDRQATVIASGRLAVGDVPGLKSVPSATGMPRSMSVGPGRRARASGTTSSRAGASRRRVDRRRRRARAAIPSADGAPGDPLTAPRSRPPAPRHRRARARRRGAAGAIPKRAPAARIRRLWSAVNTPCSQKTSREPRPALGRDPGELLVDECRTYSSAVGPVAELGRHGVGAEPRRQDVDRALPAEPMGDLEETQLGRRSSP